MQGGRWEVRHRYVFGFDEELDLGAGGDYAFGSALSEPANHIQILLPGFGADDPFDQLGEDDIVDRRSVRLVGTITVRPRATSWSL